MADIPRERQENDEPVDDVNRELRATIALGMDMQMFLDGDVGRLLRGRAAFEIKQLLAALEDVDANDPKEIIRIQCEIKVRRIWKDWIEAAVEEGKTAQGVAIERGEL